MAAPNSYQYDELLELENFMHSQQKKKPSAQVARPTPNTTRTHTKKIDAVSPQINPRIRGNINVNNVIPDNPKSQAIVTKPQVRKPTSVPRKPFVEEYDELQGKK